ncbi:complement factor H-like [Anarrhichthys ocellatus]|uniref:complement factor H-like n=1 Tax=Anarrhichthys ocellatus TaxID=433405 RepID=UPI0012ECE766|nr:complement factor H-like [Anarrhichthys ocellatus]
MHLITGSCVLVLWMYTLTLVKSQDCTREQFLNDKLFDPNFDTTDLEATYPSGTQVRVGCNVGHSGFFRLLCVKGKWTSRDSPCQPRSCGHPGEAPFADFHLEKGDDFVFGSQVLYTCNKGYQMVSRTKYRRCMSEGWDGVVPVCEAQQCPVIHVEQNVQVIGDPEEATYGNVVQFSCKSRTEILSGSQEMYCDENGEWRGQIPTCKEITCAVPEIENGFVPGDIPEYKEEEVLHFRCDARYKPTVGRPSKCIKHGIRAEWSPTPACEPIRCRLTLPPQKGTRYQSPSRNVFLPGDTVRVMCGDKYWISHPWGTSVVTTCKEDGEWTFHPVCQEVVCSNQRPQHVYHWSVEWRQRMTLGETATYLCGTGYKKTDGATSAKCTRDGWNPNPLCQVIHNFIDFVSGTPCKKLHIDNAQITNNEKDNYRPNEHVQYECRNDNKTVFTVTCEQDGWTGIKNCSDITYFCCCFSLLECPKAVVPHVFGVSPNIDTLFYTCNEGFKLSTKGWWAEVKCNEGRWFGFEHCIGKSSLIYYTSSCNLHQVIQKIYLKLYITFKIAYLDLAKMQLSFILLFLQLWRNVDVSLSQNACSKLPDVPHSHVSEDTKKAVYHEGNVIHFTCDTGYISGPTITYVCSPTTRGWLPARHGQGTCYLKPCELPDETPNGYYEIINGEEFVFGTTIKYFCNAGYQMVSKDATRTCLMDKWTNHVPICDPLSCELPPVDEGVTVKGLPENEGSILPDRFLTFSCDGPGKFLNGSSVLICGKDGQWDNPFPSCEDSTPAVHRMQPHLNADEKCKFPGVPDGVLLNTHVPDNQLRQGQNLRFECINPKDTLHGKAIVECLAGGEWSDPFPTCGAPLGCGTSPPLTDGDTTETLRFQHRHEERVQYRCQNYYTMEGEPYKTCINGEWIGRIRCLKPCTVDEEAMRSHNIDFRYGSQLKIYSRHNDHITFKCTERRIPVGTSGMRFQCVDGEMHLPTCQ